MTKAKTKKQTKPTVGDIILVPFSKEYHIYARFLEDGSLAFYDCKTYKTQNANVSDIIESNVLFTAHVNDEWKDDNLWPVIENVPLENKVSYYPVYFTPAPTNDENIDFYNEHKAEIEDLISKGWVTSGQIQLHGIYAPIHIYERLNKFYSGEIYINYNVVVFKKCLNIS